MNKPEYGWWVKNAHTDSAYLLLVTDEHLFDQAIRSRCDAVGRTDVQGVINQAKWRAIWEQDRYGALSSIVEAIQPPITLGATRPITGDIRIAGRAFRDDHGCWPVASISAFWAPWALDHDPGRLERMAEYAVGAGFTACRWFASHDWPGGLDPRHTPHYFEIMQRTVERLGELGLRSEVTLFTRRFLIDNLEEHAKQWGLIAQENRQYIGLLEIANEFNHSDNAVSPQDVRRAAEVIRAYCDTVPLALSAPAAESWEDMKAELGELYNGSVANCTTIHFPRKQNTEEGNWRWVRQPWHARHNITGCPSGPYVDNEHQRWDKAGGGRQDVAVPVAALVTAFVAGCGWSTHHDNAGVHPDEEYAAVENAQAFQSTCRAVLPHVPGDLVNWQQTRVGDGGPHPYPSLIDQHWSFENIDHGVSRAFAAVNGDRFVMSLTGVKKKVTLQEPHTSITVFSLRTGDTVYTGPGPVTLQEADGSAFLVVGSV